MDSFVDSNILGRLGNLTRTDVDMLPYGAIKVDKEGIIQLYNRYESELANVPVANAEGKNFFTQVAICTNNRLFYGRFKEGVAKGELNLVFNYVFTYNMKPSNVMIHIYHDKASDTNWVFVKFKGR
ncbi:MAG: photoactive yellow protein [Leptospiraceae bacterium]|nr:photoactive yellow protein [Leptospiraceae bacterium]